jgi:hypothetical protein
MKRIHQDLSLSSIGTIVQPNEPNQPDPNLTQILTLRAKPTRLNPILDPEGPTGKTGWVRFKLGLLSTL